MKTVTTKINKNERDVLKQYILDNEPEESMVRLLSKMVHDKVMSTGMYGYNKDRYVKKGDTLLVEDVLGGEPKELVIKTILDGTVVFEDNTVTSATGSVIWRSTIVGGKDV